MTTKESWIKIRVTNADKKAILKKMQSCGFTNLSEFIRVMAKTGTLNIKGNP
jgi:hypothetical protein